MFAWLNNKSRCNDLHWTNGHLTNYTSQTLFWWSRHNNEYFERIVPLHPCRLNTSKLNVNVHTSHVSTTTWKSSDMKHFTTLPVPPFHLHVKLAARHVCVMELISRETSRCHSWGDSLLCEFSHYVGWVMNRPLYTSMTDRSDTSEWSSEYSTSERCLRQRGRRLLSVFALTVEWRSRAGAGVGRCRPSGHRLPSVRPETVVVLHWENNWRNTGVLTFRLEGQ